MSVSIRSDPRLHYPDPGDAFSPAQAFPEYRLEHLSARPNPVYDEVRELFAQLGLDRARFGTAKWNPLGDFVPEGAFVFVLCNFVYHRRPQESPSRFHAKCSHGSVLRALVDYLLIAVGPRGRVRFGNSPLQSCDFAHVLEETGAAEVARFYAERSLPVTPRDLRLYVTARDALGRVRTAEHRDESDGVEIDLGDESLLASLARDPRAPALFRVTDYDPSRTEAFHQTGQHRYVIHRDVLAADIVVSLPKLKTHEKVGITCGLKGFVGSVGHKDCLAHHRLGSPRRGGDEYPDAFGFLEPVSRLHDWVYRRQPHAPLQGLAQAVDRTLRRIADRSGAVMSGAWHGNDTAWRMALDLARILYFADARGNMCEATQRRHLSLIDGIVAGEGNGPLDPRPVAARVLLFGDDVTAVDRAACRLMGFDPDEIPLLRTPLQPMRHKITALELGKSFDCVQNGLPLTDAELAPVLGRPFEPPKGWRSHLGARSARAVGTR